MKTNILLLALVVILSSIVACDFPSNKKTSAQENKYLDKGNTIAMQTFGELAGKLQQAVQEGGVPHAIAFCNLNAYPLVDSLARINKVSIRRTSLQIRNLENKPTPAEKTILHKYAEQKKAGVDMKPMVLTQGKDIAYYAPIGVNDFCLKCHGKKEVNIAPESYSAIQKYYPKDQAIGYAAGDLRGIWSISWTQE